MMVDAIEQAIRNVLHSLFQSIANFFDPFWGWAVEGVLIIAACFAAAWFFSILRPVAGAVVMATIAFLVGFWKGENKSR